jgi:hypothetical protein
MQVYMQLIPTSIVGTIGQGASPPGFLLFFHITLQRSLNTYWSGYLTHMHPYQKICLYCAKKIMAK